VAFVHQPEFLFSRNRRFETKEVIAEPLAGAMQLKGEGVVRVAATPSSPGFWGKPNSALKISRGEAPQPRAAAIASFRLSDGVIRTMEFLPGLFDCVDMSAL
jgi:hypothetical protein